MKSAPKQKARGFGAATTWAVTAAAAALVVTSAGVAVAQTIGAMCMIEKEHSHPCFQEESGYKPSRICPSGSSGPATPCADELKDASQLNCTDLIKAEQGETGNLERDGYDRTCEYVKKKCDPSGTCLVDDPNYAITVRCYEAGGVSCLGTGQGGGGGEDAPPLEP